MKQEYISPDLMMLVHVPPECVSDIKAYIGPFEPRVSDQELSYSTILTMKDKPLSGYFSIRKADQTSCALDLAPVHTAAN